MEVRERILCFSRFIVNRLRDKYPEAKCKANFIPANFIRSQLKTLTGHRSPVLL